MAASGSTGGKPACLSRVAGRQPLVWVLSASGLGSAERCLSLVLDGRVKVNGQVVDRPQARADPLADEIQVDGQPLALTRCCRYLVLNKPYGVVCAFTDKEGHPTLAGYVQVPGVWPAGRLDLDSEGLLLLTDDGWLIHRLVHPRYRHPRTYLVQVEGIPDATALATLREGVSVKGRRTAPAMVELLPEPPDLPERPVPIRFRKSVPTSWLRLVLTEGRKRQVRHMTAAVGHPTLRLVRVSLGPLELKGLSPGEWRDLTSEELAELRRSLTEPAEPGRSGARKPSRQPRRRPAGTTSRQHRT